MSEKELTYGDTEISERLKGLPGWYHEDGWIGASTRPTDGRRR